MRQGVSWEDADPSKITRRVGNGASRDSASGSGAGLHGCSPDGLRGRLDSGAVGAGTGSFRAAGGFGFGEGSRPRRERRGDAVGDRGVAGSRSRRAFRTWTRCAGTRWHGRCWVCGRRRTRVARGNGWRGLVLLGQWMAFGGKAICLPSKGPSPLQRPVSLSGASVSRERIASGHPPRRGTHRM